MALNVRSSIKEFDCEQLNSMIDALKQYINKPADTKKELLPVNKKKQTNRNSFQCSCGKILNCKSPAALKMHENSKYHIENNSE